MLQDRVGDRNLKLTQEIIASRLGACRAGITVATGTLQAIHALDYRLGQLHITEREVLQHAVCECYQIMKSDFRFTPPARYRPSGLSL
jgi:alcohol dehydrogenase class IV